MVTLNNGVYTASVTINGQTYTATGSTLGDLNSNMQKYNNLTGNNQQVFAALAQASDAYALKQYNATQAGKTPGNGAPIDISTASVYGSDEL